MAHAQLKQTRLVLSELQAQVAARRGATASPGEPINRRLDLVWLSEHITSWQVQYGQLHQHYRRVAQAYVQLTQDMPDRMVELPQVA